MPLIVMLLVMFWQGIDPACHCRSHSLPPALQELSSGAAQSLAFFLLEFALSPHRQQLRERPAGPQVVCNMSFMATELQKDFNNKA